MSSISQTVVTPQPEELNQEFTFHFYKIQSFSTSTKGPRFHFQKKVHSETLSIDAFLNQLTGKKAFLYTRTVIFVHGAQINQINPQGALVDLKCFLKAMYLMVPRKSLPESTHQDERDAKFVNFSDAIQSLKIFVRLSSDPKFAKHTKLRTFANYFIGYLYTYGIGVERNFDLAKQSFNKAIALGYVEAYAFRALMTLEQTNFISNEECYGTQIKMDDLKKTLGPNGNLNTWLANRTVSSTQELIAAGQKGSIIAALELADQCRTSMITTHLENALHNYALIIQQGHCANREPQYAYLRCFSSAAPKNKAALKKELKNLINILEKAERAGIPEAYLYLGHLYRDGSGVTQDTKKALDYYYKAAEHHFSEAYPQIIRIRMQYGTAADLKEAIRLFAKLMRISQKALQTPNDTTFKIHYRDTLTNVLMRTLAIFTAEDYSVSVQNLRKAMQKYKIQLGIEIPETLAEAKKVFRIQDYLWNRLPLHTQQRISNFFKKISPERKAELMDFLVPCLYEFTQDYTLFNKAKEESRISDDFIDFIRNKRPDYESIEKQKSVLFALSRVSPPEFLILSLLLDNPDFHIDYIQSIPFYAWDDRQTVESIHQNLILFYLRCGLASEEDWNVILGGDLESLPIFWRNACIDIAKLMNRVDVSNKEIRQNNTVHELIWLALNRAYLNRHFRTNNKYSNSIAEDYQDNLCYFYTISTQSCMMDIPQLKKRCRVELSAYPTSQALDILEKICLLRLDITPFRKVFTTSIGPKFGTKFDRTVEARMIQVQKIMEELRDEFNHEKLETEKREKEAKSREAALAQQQKLEQVRATLWKKIQDESSTDIQTYIDLIESAKNLTTEDKNQAEEILVLMAELNRTIQATTTFSNDLKQKWTELKKRMYNLVRVENVTVNESQITPFIHPEPQVNFKKEVLESHATLDERNKARQEKVKVVTSEKVEKQRQYQEAQEAAAKIESTQKSDSASSDDDKETTLTTQKNISSFKDKMAKQIFHSQEDEYAGNAVRLLNLLNGAENFEDIVNQATRGDDLHELKAENHKTYGTHYALRVNDQFRITFYWHENKAHRVWFGDYHTK